MTLKEIIFLVEEDPEGGYTAQSWGINAIFTQGDTLDQLKKNIKDALSCHYDSPKEIPECIRLHIVREERLAYG